VGGGHAAVMAAVSAGLAVAAFSCRLAPPDTIEVSQRFGLPRLPSSRIVLHSMLTDARSRDVLRTLIATYHEARPARPAPDPCRPDAAGTGRIAAAPADEQADTLLT